MKREHFLSRSARVGASAAGGFLLVAAMASTPAGAESSTVVFKNFHRYPASGLWSQELSGTRDGVSLGPPQTTQSCTGVADPKTLAAMQKLSETSMTTCKTNVITDTERLVEYERTCMVSGTPRVMHSTMRSVDDKTMTIDTRDDSPGLPRTIMHSKVSYLGTCTAAASKPSPAECAEMASGMKELAGGEAQCAQAPAASRAQCVAQIGASRQMAETILAQCK